MFGELTNLAIRNMLRARGRLLMTVGGVLVGTAAVILLIALTIGLQTSAEADIGNDPYLLQMYLYSGFYGLGAQAPEEVPELTPQNVRGLWRIPGVQAVFSPIPLQGGFLGVEGQSIQGYAESLGVDPSILPYLGLSAAEGTLSLNPGEVILGSDVAQNFYDPDAEEYTQITVDPFEDQLQLIISRHTENGEEIIAELPLRVTSVLNPSNDFSYRILFNVQDIIAYNELLGVSFDAETFRFDSVVVYASNRETVESVFYTLKEMGYQVSGNIEYLRTLNQFFTSMRLMLGGIGSVALVVAAFGVVNTMMMAILERTREIGLMKAVGARDQDVLAIFLIEAGLVGFIGGVSGVLVALGLQQLVNQAVIASAATQDPTTGYNFLPVDPNNLQNGLLIIPSELILFGLTLATMVGSLSGVYPALRAARLSPVEALKTD